MGFKMYIQNNNRGNVPFVTLTKKGTAVYNTGCVQIHQLNGKKYVQYWYDSETRQVGFELLKKPAPNSYKLRKLNENNNRYVHHSLYSTISSFLKANKIDFSRTKRYPVSWDKKKQMLIIEIPRKKS